MTTYRCWQDDEISQLRELCAQNITAKSIATQMGRCRQSIEAKASELGIVVHKIKLEWTPDLRRRFQEAKARGLSVAGIADELNIPIASVYHRTKYSGLRFRSTWTNEQLDYLRKSYSSVSWREMSRVIGKRATNIRAKANSLGLTRGSSRIKEIDQLGDGDAWRKYRYITESGITACQKCGEWRWLVVHHVDENHYNNEVSNLMVLCPNCHAEIHGNRMAKCICRGCKKTFLVPERYAANRNPVFCSAKCRRAKVTKKCPECGKDFEVGKWRSSTKTWCGRVCQNHAMATRRWKSA